MIRGFLIGICQGVGFGLAIYLMANWAGVEVILKQLVH